MSFASLHKQHSQKPPNGLKMRVKQKIDLYSTRDPTMQSNTDWEILRDARQESAIQLLGIQTLLQKPLSKASSKLLKERFHTLKKLLPLMESLVMKCFHYKKMFEAAGPPSFPRANHAYATHMSMSPKSLPMKGSHESNSQVPGAPRQKPLFSLVTLRNMSSQFVGRTFAGSERFNKMNSLIFQLPKINRNIILTIVNMYLEETLIMSIQVLHYRSIFYGEGRHDREKALNFSVVAYRTCFKLLPRGTAPIFAMMQKVRLYYAKLLIEDEQFDAAMDLLKDNIKDAQIELSMRGVKLGEHILKNTKCQKTVVAIHRRFGCSFSTSYSWNISSLTMRSFLTLTSVSK